MIWQPGHTITTLVRYRSILIRFPIVFVLYLLAMFGHGWLTHNVFNGSERYDMGGAIYRDIHG